MPVGNLNGKHLISEVITVQHDFEELNRNADLPALVSRYVEWDRGRSNSRDLWACCPFHSEKTPSFHVFEDRGRWRWKCFGQCAAGGDALDFLERVGMSKADAIEVLGGVRLAPNAALKTGPAAQADNSERIKRALAIWGRTLPIGATLGEIYLRTWRNLTGEFTADVRYCGGVYYRPVKRETPAIVSAIRDANGKIKAVHSIHLSADGSKLDADPRRCWGLARGGAVRLDDPKGTVFVTEGVEDGIAVRAALASEKSAVWAAPSASFLHLVEFPETVQRVVICADNDDAGRAAANRLKLRMLTEGRRVRICLPPNEGADWSDILTKEEVAA